MAIQPPRKVLVALDGSDSSMYALQWFRKGCIKDKDEVFLFHCTEPVVKGKRASFSLRASLTKSVDQKEPVDVVELIEKLVAEVEFKATMLHVEGSKPGEAIIKAAEDYKIDLIIVGGRGKNDKTSHVGSVSHYVMHHAKVPTIICKMT